MIQKADIAILIATFISPNSTSTPYDVKSHSCRCHSCSSNALEHRPDVFLLVSCRRRRRRRARATRRAPLACGAAAHSGRSARRRRVSQIVGVLDAALSPRRCGRAARAVAPLARRPCSRCRRGSRLIFARGVARRFNRRFSLSRRRPTSTRCSSTRAASSPRARPISANLSLGFSVTSARCVPACQCRTVTTQHLRRRSAATRRASSSARSFSPTTAVQ
jgi:hypothetical protein